MNTSRPWITSLEKDYVNQALDAADVGVGSFLGRFEQSWATYNGYTHGVACNSGTTALYLALLALRVGEGDEVIVPEFTMIATAWAVTYTGATPVFVDCLNDLTIDPHLMQAALTPRTKAIISVPIYGRNVSEFVFSIAADHGIPVIEDMAEAHGIKPRGVIACYSFHGSKIITTGGGGMCLTKNDAYMQEMRLLAHLYLDKGMTMIHPKIGHNFRLSNLQAAVGLAQVERMEEILKKRQQIAGWYDSLIPAKMRMPRREVVWVYDIDCDDQQEAIKARLAKAGIESRYFFKPMSMQPMYEDKYTKLEAYTWSKRGLYLPLYPEMEKDDVEKVVQYLHG